MPLRLLAAALAASAPAGSTCRRRARSSSSTPALGRRPLGRTALLAASGFAVLALAPAARAATPPAEMLRASRLYAADVAGVIGHLEEADTHVTGPMLDRKARTRAWIVSRDGLPVQARILSYVTGGKPDEGERANLERRINEGYKGREREFRPPFAPAHLDAYTFSAEGPGRFAFKALARDERHGDGTLELDPKGNVRLVRYVPAKVPAPGAEGTVELGRGPVGTGAWGRVRLKIAFEGGVGPLRGSFTLTQKVSGHRRFASVAEAVAAAPN